jgi:hypothetical protein
MPICRDAARVSPIPTNLNRSQGAEQAKPRIASKPDPQEYARTPRLLQGSPVSDSDRLLRLESPATPDRFPERSGSGLFRPGGVRSPGWPR